MINELVNDLRKESKRMSEYGVNYMATLLVRAADTIELLSERLFADRPQGKWIIEMDTNGNTYGRCSICNMKQYAGQLNFCPDCGAKMKGVDDE